ncbi:MAG: mannose-1-phosphate guanylyltransferase [Allosphingosinicella sp.]
MAMPPAPITPVILSGGTGVRLWPLSRLGRPKQLLSLSGGETLLQQTARRVADPERFATPLVVAAAADADAIEAQLDEAGVPLGRLLLEPEPRGTAAAAALAALAAPAEALLLILPSDHAIADPAGFLAAIDAGRDAAEAKRVVCFGIDANRPETGYGWVKAREPVEGGAFAAAAFREKPDRAAAEAMLAEGGWRWNAGIFLVRADALLAELARLAPALLAAAREAMAGARAEGTRLSPDRDAFARAPAGSLDRVVMERTEALAVVPADMGWSDIGSWAAVHALGPADADGNVLAGDVAVPGSRNCLVRSDGPTIVALGVEDLVIVATERAVLVVPRRDSQRIQEAIDALDARRAPRQDEESET